MSRDESQRDAPSPEEALAGEAGEPRRRKSLFREYVEPLLVILFVALVIRTFVIHAYRIPSGSMEDTLLVGDYLLANRFVWGAPVEIPFTGIVLGRLPAFNEPRRGDIAIFASWQDTTEDFIKRIVGLPGDTILVRDDLLTVNGKPFRDELNARFGHDPRIFPEIKFNPTRSYRHRGFGGSLASDYGPHVVAPGHVFAMGDNRHNSSDSRYQGDIPLHRLKARAMIIYWSMDLSRPLWNLAEFVRWERIGRLIH